MNGYVGNVPDAATSSAQRGSIVRGQETSMLSSISGALPGYGVPFSSTFPLPVTSGPASQSFLSTSMRGIPSTGAASRARATRYWGGMSQNHPMVTPSYRLRPFSDGRHTMLYEGQLAFAFRGGNLDEDMVTMLNVRLINEFWRKMYYKAYELLRDALDTNQGIGDLSAEAIKTLASMPTHTWPSHDGFVRCMGTDNSAMRALTYLCPSVMFQQWNFAGMFLGQMQTNSTYGYANTTVLAKGETEDMVNIWGPNLEPGDELCLIFKQTSEYVRDSSGTKIRIPGPPALIPWAGPHRPSMEELAYRDVTGHIAIGYVQKIATFMNFDAINRSTSDKQYAIEAGTVPAPEGYLFNNPLDASITVFLDGRVGLYTPFYS